jgi:hypothetical protein
LFNSTKMRKFGHTPFSQLFVFVGLIAVISVLALAGCSKSQAPTPTSTASPQDTTQTQTATPQPSVQQTPGTATTQGAATNGQPDLASLQRTLIHWVVGHRRRPANFEEFAATAGVTIPPPPPGQKYFITDRLHIELVDINSNP